MEAAVRELTEETGHSPVWISAAGLSVHRDYMWCGKRYRNKELFFLARVDSRRPPLPLALSKSEQSLLAGRRWWTWPQVLCTPDRIEPVNLVDVLLTFAPTGPWKRTYRIEQPTGQEATP